MAKQLMIQNRARTHESIPEEFDYAVYVLVKDTYKQIISMRQLDGNEAGSDAFFRVVSMEEIFEDVVNYYVREVLSRDVKRKYRDLTDEQAFSVADDAMRQGNSAELVKMDVRRYLYHMKFSYYESAFMGHDHVPCNSAQKMLIEDITFEKTGEEAMS